MPTCCQEAQEGTFIGKEGKEAICQDVTSLWGIFIPTDIAIH